jgi:flagellar biosynthesis/type III secretory pathway protein FliH
MSALIRREASEQAQAIGPWRPAAVNAPEPTQEDPRFGAYRAEIEALETRITTMGAAHAEAIKRARAEAHEEASRTFARDEAKALAALEGAIAAASSKFSNALDGVERLAPLICETALAGVFENVECYRPQIEAVIAAQMRTLARDSVMAIRVSSVDFHDDEALTRLTIPYPGVEVERDQGLQAGTCQISLRLGAIEIDLAAHWRTLQEKLRAMAGGT